MVKKVKTEYILIDKMTKPLKAMRSQLLKLSVSLKNLGKSAAIPFVALGAAIVKVTKLAGTQESAINSLNQALINSGNYSEEASKDLQDYASSLQLLTTYGDEAIIGVQTMIASFGIEGEELKGLTKATLDLAAAKKMDLKSAADIVAKSVGSTTNALTRYGVEITGAAGSTERSAMAIENINKLFGGQALAATKGFGKIKQLSNAIGDLGEKIGFALEPVIVRGTESLIRLVGWIDKHPKITTFTAIILASTTALLGLAVALGAVSAGMAIILGPVGWIALGVVAFGTLSTAIYKFRVEIGNAMIFAKNMVIDFVISSVSALEELINKLASLVPMINKIPGVNIEIDESIINLDALKEKLESFKSEYIQLKTDQADEEIEVEKTKEEIIAKVKAKAVADRLKKEQEFNKKLVKGSLETVKEFSDLSSAARAAGMEDLKEMVFIQKGIMQGQILMKSYDAAMGAYAAMAPIPFIGPALGAVAAGTALAYGGALVSKSAGIKFAEGGIVKPTAGGTHAIIGEAGETEVVSPLSQLPDLLREAGVGGSETMNVNVYLDGKQISRNVTKHQRADARRGTN